MKAVFDGPMESAGAYGAHGRGGYYRSAQIQELVARAQVDLQPVLYRPFHSRAERVRSLPHVMRRWNCLENLSKRNVERSLSLYADYKNAFTHAGKGAFLLSNYSFQWPGWWAALDSGVPIVACADALTSLWQDGSFLFGTAGSRFDLAHEARMLSHSRAIFCISREEQWLLANCGVRSHYLPYYPEHSREIELLNVRKNRVAEPPKEFLLCVVLGNSDIEDSYAQQADMIHDLFSGADVVFHVTGYASDELRHLYQRRPFRFHGATDKAHWNDLLSRVRATVIHGSRGVGALTRIVEMLLCGIPVISNGISARSSFSYSGLHVYESPDDFARMIRCCPGTTTAPARPVECEELFIENVKLCAAWSD